MDSETNGGLNTRQADERDISTLLVFYEIPRGIILWHCTGAVKRIEDVFLHRVISSVDDSMASGIQDAVISTTILWEFDD